MSPEMKETEAYKFSLVRLNITSMPDNTVNDLKEKLLLTHIHETAYYNGYQQAWCEMALEEQRIKKEELEYSKRKVEINS